MPNYNQIRNSLVQLSNNNIGVKNSPDSITPTDVHQVNESGFTAIFDILNTINSLNLLGGDQPPLNSQGLENDFYLQVGNSISGYKKLNGAWQQFFNIPFGIQVPDGNGTLQSSVSQGVVTVSPGVWWINNVQYVKAVQDQFTVPTADFNLDRIDAVFGKTDNTVYYATGTASANPDNTKPSTPLDQILVTYVYVPRGSSGNPPYISDSSVPPVPVGLTKNIIMGNQSNTVADNGQGYVEVPEFNDETFWKASYTLNGTTSQIDETMLQNGRIYGFPDPSAENFTFKIVYI